MTTQTQNETDIKLQWRKRAMEQYEAASRRGWDDVALIFMRLAIQWGLV